MIGSSLPEDILVAWQRSPLSRQDGSKFVPVKTESDFLMEFLREEVESESQRDIVRAGFETMKIKKEKTAVLEKKEDLPTAAGLFAGQSKQCVFCYKTNHQSSECQKAEKMSWEDKSQVLKKNRVCFRCMRFGHRKADCKVKIKCQICGDSHFKPMCPMLPSNQKPQEDHGRRIEFENRSSSEPTLSAANASHACRDDVLMKTVLIRVVGQKGNRVVRLIFDEGSQ